MTNARRRGNISNQTFLSLEKIFSHCGDENRAYSPQNFDILKTQNKIITQFIFKANTNNFRVKDNVILLPVSRIMPVSKHEFYIESMPDVKASANKRYLELKIESHISLTNLLNSKVPQVAPCGTVDFTIYENESVPEIQPEDCLLVR
jgi:hypothetical protein